MLTGTTCATINSFDSNNNGTFDYTLDGLTPLASCSDAACQSGSGSGGLGGSPPSSPPSPPSGGGGGGGGGIEELSPE